MNLVDTGKKKLPRPVKEVTMMTPVEEVVIDKNDMGSDPSADPNRSDESSESSESEYERSYWRYSPFDLVGDCTVTIAAVCFPLTPWLYQAIAERLNYFPVSGNKLCFLVWIILFVYVEIAIQITMNIYRIVSGETICSSRIGCAVEYSLDFVAFVCSLFLCAVAVSLRQRARRENAIRGRCLPEEDVCLSLFCLPCSLIQVAREVNAGPEITYCEIPDANAHVDTVSSTVQMSQSSMEEGDSALTGKDDKKIAVTVSRTIGRANAKPLSV